MSEDTMTKIRLGIVMPQLDEKIAPAAQEILTAVGEIIKKGGAESDKVDVQGVKEIFLEGLNKMLDRVLPEVDKTLNPPPPAEEVPEAEEPS